MKNRSKLFLAVSSAVFLGLFSMQSCEKSTVIKKTKTVQTTDADALTAALVVNGATRRTGDIPAPSTSPNRPVITMADSAVGCIVGGDMWLYIQSASAAPIDSVYLQVAGAKSYFAVPATAVETTDGTMALSVTLPSTIAEGVFRIRMSLHNINAQVSDTFAIIAAANWPKNCDFEVSAGGLPGGVSKIYAERVSSMTYHMGDKAGHVSINYYAYGLPLRIDVYQNGKWLMGTEHGNVVHPDYNGRAPQLRNCRYLEDGYTTENSRMGFQYYPEDGKDITVLVTGAPCGHPMWKYTISCPQAEYTETETRTDYGWLTLNDKTYQVYQWLGDSSSTGLHFYVYLDTVLGVAGSYMDFYIRDYRTVNLLDATGGNSIEFHERSDSNSLYKDYYSSTGHLDLYPPVMASLDYNFHRNQQILKAEGWFSATMSSKAFNGRFSLYR